MNNLKNKVQLIGHLGMNPEVRTTESGKKLARLSIATNESYKNAKGERISTTQWHNIVAWGKVADIAEQFLQKGAEVLVDGKLVYREYTDKLGTRRNITEVLANDFLMLQKK